MSTRPTLKRTYHVSERAGTAPLAKRLKKIEKIQRERKPEMKYIDHVFNGAVNNATIQFINLTSIPEGDTHATRSGRLIKIHRVEVRGGAQTASLVSRGYGVYLQTQRDNSDPVIGDYSAAIGGFVELDKAVVWEFQLAGAGGYSDTNIHFAKSFPYPMKIHYDGSLGTNTIRNKTCLVLHNRTGSNATLSFTARVWFTDV